MQTPPINAGSSLASALAHHSATMAQTRNIGVEQTFGGIASALESLNKTYRLRKEEEQKQKDNTYRENVFNLQKQTIERNYNYQKERDLIKDKQWQKEYGLRAAINNENLKQMRRQNAFLDALHQSARGGYEAPIQAQETTTPKLFYSKEELAQQNAQVQENVESQTNANIAQTQTQENNTQAQKPQTQSIAQQRTTFLNAWGYPRDKNVTELMLTSKKRESQETKKSKTQQHTSQESESATPQAQSTQPQEQGSVKLGTAESQTHKSAQAPQTAQNFWDTLAQSKETQKSEQKNFQNHPLRYFREKINSGTPLDEVDYLHLQGMGLNPNGMGSFNANVNGDIKLSTTSATKSIERLGDYALGMSSVADLIKLGVKAAGVKGAAERFLNAETKGFYGLDPAGSAYQTKLGLNNYAIAKMLKDGKLDVDDKKRVEKMMHITLANKNQVGKTMSEFINYGLLGTQKEINTLRTMGKEPPQKMINLYNGYREIVGFLQSPDNRINWGRFNKAMDYIQAYERDKGGFDLAEFHKLLGIKK